MPASCPFVAWRLARTTDAFAVRQAEFSLQAAVAQLGREIHEFPAGRSSLRDGPPDARPEGRRRPAPPPPPHERQAVERFSDPLARSAAIALHPFPSVAGGFAPLAELVESEGFEARQSANGADALAGLADGTLTPDVILLDIRMPGADGLVVLREIRDQDLSDAPIIMVSAYEDSARTIEAMRLGAYDYVTKPIDLDELTATLRRAIAQRRSTLEQARGPRTSEVAGVDDPGSLIGTGRPMRDVLKRVGRLAATDATVLIAGESGTGKDTRSLLWQPHGRGAEAADQSTAPLLEDAGPWVGMMRPRTVPRRPDG